MAPPTPEDPIPGGPSPEEGRLPEDGPVPQAAEQITLGRVQAAKARTEAELVHTPTRHSKTLTEVAGVQLWFKYDHLQYTASFKERGALNKLLTLTAEQRSRGVVAASAGNHAQAVAHHARRLGIAATIVMPTSAPFAKVTSTEVLGASVVQAGETVDAANQRARELAKSQGLTLVHPFDDVEVICGQGTLALEVLQDLPEFDTLVVPIGGGGLISGVAAVLKALAPNVRIVGVQSALFPAAANHFRARSLAPDVLTAQAEPGRTPSLGPFGADTLADGIAVKAPGVIARVLIQRWVDEVLEVNEAALEQACNAFIEIEKTVVEGAGAAALAAVLQHPSAFSGQRVVCVVSGGNMDPRVMADTLMRGLARTGRLTRLRVDVRDLPGALADITRIVADAGANIVDVRHERIFLATPTLRTRLSLELATRHPAHAQSVADALSRAGHRVEVV